MVRKGKLMISIIVLTYNGHEMTHECLKAVRENTHDCELIVVDNGSEPEFIPEFPATVIRNVKNEGFPKAVNQGVRAAKGSTIILLNNDCIVTSGWAEGLEMALDEYSITGPMTNYCAGMQRVTLPVYHNETELNQVARDWAAQHNGESQEVNWVIGFCFAFKKSLYDSVGPFDESMWPCSGEEIDFCLKARKAGYKIGIAKDVYVHHHGSQTFRDMEKAGQLNYDDVCLKCHKHLIDRYGADYVVQI